MLPQRRTLMGEFDQKYVRPCKVPTLRFVIVNFFQSNSNRFLVNLIRSSKLASTLNQCTDKLKNLSEYQTNINGIYIALLYIASQTKNCPD